MFFFNLFIFVCLIYMLCRYGPPSLFRPVCINYRSHFHIRVWQYATLIPCRFFNSLIFLFIYYVHNVSVILLRKTPFLKIPHYLINMTVKNGTTVYITPLRNPSQNYSLHMTSRADVWFTSTFIVENLAWVRVHCTWH